MHLKHIRFNFTLLGTFNSYSYEVELTWGIPEAGSQIIRSLLINRITNHHLRTAILGLNKCGCASTVTCSWPAHTRFFVKRGSKNTERGIFPPISPSQYPPTLGISWAKGCIHFKTDSDSFFQISRPAVTPSRTWQIWCYLLPSGFTFWSPTSYT